MIQRTMLLCLIFLSSCLGDYSQNRIDAENLVLNECDFVMQQFKNEIPTKKVVQTCGCISELLKEDLLEKYDIQELKQKKDLRRKILKREINLSKKQIRNKCLNK